MSIPVQRVLQKIFNKKIFLSNRDSGVSASAGSRDTTHTANHKWNGCYNTKNVKVPIIIFPFWKKTKKNFFEPHPGKEQEKGENIWKYNIHFFPPDLFHEKKNQKFLPLIFWYSTAQLFHRLPITTVSRPDLTLFSKCFASLPHGTCSLSVSCQYLKKFQS